MHIAIRADASPTMGAGHVMRCIALAQAAQRMGISCSMMGKVQVPWLTTRLQQEGIPFTAVSGDILKEENPQSIIDSLLDIPKGSWIVLDGYQFTFDCQKAVQDAGYKLLVIDDYAHLPEYTCDILLNQNISAEELVYNGTIGTKLLGLEYVLLRQEFIEARAKAEQRIFPETPQKLLLTLGGGDFSTHLARIAPYFCIPEMQGRIVRIIKGSMDECYIHECFQDCPATIEILQTVRDMPSLLLDTDLCITAGGSTCWELCCLGVPFLTVEIAENQRNIVIELENKKRALPFSITNFMAAITNCYITKFFTTPFGADKVIHAMQRKTISCVVKTIRPVVEGDIKFLFGLANDETIRKASFKAQKIEWNGHVQWFTYQLQNKNPFYIIEANAEPCGYIRFKMVDDVSKTYELSIGISCHCRKNGLAMFAVQEACKKVFSDYAATKIIASVKKENEASITLFLRSHFIEDVSTKDARIFYCLATSE